MSIDETTPGGGDDFATPEEPAGRTQPGVPWGAKDSVLITLFSIVSIIVCMVVFNIILAAAGLSGDSSKASPVPEFGSDIVFYSAILLACFLFLRHRHYHVSLSMLGFRRTRLGKAILWTLLVYVLDTIGTAVWLHFVQSEPLPVKTEYGATVLGFMLAYLGIAVLAPVVEELFFRGILFQGFSQSFGPLWGGVTSAAVFTIFHVDPHVFGRIFWTGILFAFLFYKTKSLWPSIVCHFIVNSLAVIALFAS